MVDVQAWMREKKNRVLVARFLREVGLNGTDGQVEHLGVALEAVAVYEDRTALYRDTWRGMGAIDNLQTARRKLARQLNIVSVICEGSPPVLKDGNLDDAIDVINYVTFGIRNMRLLNFDGEGE